jgi:hypothetical protein
MPAIGPFFHGKGRDPVPYRPATAVPATSPAPALVGAEASDRFPSRNPHEPAIAAVKAINRNHACTSPRRKHPIVLQRRASVASFRRRTAFRMAKPPSPQPRSAYRRATPFAARSRQPDLRGNARSRIPESRYWSPPGPRPVPRAPLLFCLRSMLAAKINIAPSNIAHASPIAAAATALFIGYVGVLHSSGWPAAQAVGLLQCLLLSIRRAFEGALRDSDL